MDNYRDKLKQIGEKFGVDITPENADDILRNSWEKYHRSVKKK